MALITTGKPFIRELERVGALGVYVPLGLGARVMGDAETARARTLVLKADRVESVDSVRSRAEAWLDGRFGGAKKNFVIGTYRGRVEQVYVQADAPYRSTPSDINRWFVRNNQGDMVPFSSFATTG